MEVYLEGNVVVRQDEQQIRRQRGPADRPRPAAVLRLPHRPVPGAQCRDRLVRPVAPGAGQDQVAAHRAVSPAGAVAQRDLRPRRGPRDPCRAVDHDRQPVSRPGLQDHQLVDRSDQAYAAASPIPNTGKEVKNPRSPSPDDPDDPKDPNDPDATPEELVWRLDARQNIYFAGPFPVFYWPHIVMDLDDLEPPVRMIGFATNNYFGQQFKVDFNGFRLISQRRPKFIDLWNVDVDYLSARTKDFPALGSEMGWYGTDLLQDLSDPYHERPQSARPHHQELLRLF